eukprot:6178226-Pleurochrysis_carterae.AAC.1
MHAWQRHKLLLDHMDARATAYACIRAQVCASTFESLDLVMHVLVSLDLDKARSRSSTGVLVGKHATEHACVDACFLAANPNAYMCACVRACNLCACACALAFASV